jgi:drug/metabolite transporter (DMT)-like permease
MRQNQVAKGFVLALFAATLWGVSGTLGQYVFQQKGINVEWMITCRMLVAGSILLIISFVRNTKETLSIWKNKRDALQMTIFSITGMLGVQYTYFAAVKYSNASTATILQFAGPVVISVYLAIKRRKLPQPTELLAITMAVLGTFLLVTHADISSLSISPIAFFMGIASAFALAIYTLQPVQLLKRYESTTVVGWGMFLGGLAFSWVKAPWKVEGIWDAHTLTAVTFIVLFGTLVAFYSYLTSVKLIGGQRASLLAAGEPLSATLIAVCWLHIPFTWMDSLGSLLIISTVFILSFQPGKLSRRQAAQ